MTDAKGKMEFFDCQLRLRSLPDARLSLRPNRRRVDRGDGFRQHQPGLGLSHDHAVRPSAVGNRRVVEETAGQPRLIADMGHFPEPDR